ncbi:asparagine synthetase B, partial [Candidatus Gottesmanbacteria bacterium]|nr:asparagine synthetase B [Candidatus Gottesmanbacteria bacterium]
VKTFSMGFTHRRYDESLYARAVASFLHTDHHHETCTQATMLAAIPELMELLDEPLGDPSIVPTYLLSKMTRKYVTVALSGDGGDELFAGYPTYIAHSIARVLHHVPGSLHGALGQVSSLFAGALGLLPFMRHTPTMASGDKVRRFFTGMDHRLARQYINFLGPMHLGDKDKLIIDHQETALPLVEEFLHGVADLDVQTKLQYLDLMIYLAEDCLVKVDRASSYASLEVRVPMLDDHLTNFALSLPAHFHLRGWTLKHLLKKAAAGYIPDDIINRPKKGFGIPVNQWLRGALHPMVTSYLSPRKLKKQGLFHGPYVESLLGEHMAGRDDHSMTLWNLLIFQLWYERWMGRL